MSDLLAAEHLGALVVIAAVISFLVVAVLLLKDRSAYDHTQEYETQEVEVPTGVRRQTAG